MRNVRDTQMTRAYCPHQICRERETVCGNNNTNNDNNNNNTENVVYENRSDPCGCWCAWYSEEGMVENIKKVSERANMIEIQKVCMLGSARILRKVLSV